jgi:hypothetical protein
MGRLPSCTAEIKIEFDPLSMLLSTTLAYKTSDYDWNDLGIVVFLRMRPVEEK